MRRYLRTVLCVFVVFAGCKKSGVNEDFLNPGKVYDLSVEGGFNTRLAAQYIRLSKPALHPDSLPTPIRKASVVINDGRTDMVLRETSTAGIYSGSNRNEPNYNGAYTLTIKYENKIYTAVDTLRQVVNIIDDFLPLSMKLQPDGLYAGSIPKHTFGYLNANKWMISYALIPQWLPNKFEQSQYYSYTHALGSPNSLYPLNNLKRTFTLGKDDYIYIYKLSLSEAYSRYLYAVFMETDWNGLFSGVPVNVDGNITGNAQGYFSAIDVDFRRYKASEL